MSKEIGNLGEACAAEYLKCKGYEIVEKNYHSRYGEIDIIAENPEYIVFVEVKTRKVDSMIRGIYFVGRAKQIKIIKTALEYLQKNNTIKQVRFDAIEVEFKDRNNVFVKNHIENAFAMEDDYAVF